MASQIEQVVEMDSDEKTQEKLESEKNICETNRIREEVSPSFSKLLEGVVLAANSAVSSNPSLQPTVAFQGQFGMSHQEALGTVTAIAAQALRQMKPEDDPDARASEAPKTPKSDGYCWRKYGQKHVKSSGSSRSYFRCTNPTCIAKKKVQHIDGSGEIIEVDYKGDHNHDPPPYIIKNFTRKKSFSDSSSEKFDAPCREEPRQVLQLTYECQDTHLNNSVGKLKKDAEEQEIKIPDTTIRVESEPSTLPVVVERGRSSNSTELSSTETMNERDIPIKKRRIKESGKESCQPVYRTFKEPKIVVHATGDAGISSDGYRWRKYGQKMVKGNLHSRSYYRCSSAGCPVRKHVERATDGSSAIVAMYEGEHNHDKPLPKKQHNSLNNVPLLKPEEEKPTSPRPGPGSAAQPCEVPNNEGPLSEPGAEKVLEPPRTILSIGIELESC